MINPDYQTPDGRVTLYCADCLDVLREMPDGSVDLCITDPPYGEETHAGARRNVTDKLVTFDSIDDDTFLTYVDEISRVTLRWCVMSCEWRHAVKLEKRGILVRLGVWVKPSYTPQFTGDRPAMGWEAIAICHRPGRKRWNGGGTSAVWTHNKDYGYHPTQKPVPLVIEWCQLFSDLHETIIDPFMGSGTTGVACIRTGRKFIGIEKEPKYFDIAVQRIETALEQAKQMPLFEDDIKRPQQETLL